MEPMYESSLLRVGASVVFVLSEFESEPLAGEGGLSSWCRRRLPQWCGGRESCPSPSRGRVTLWEVAGVSRLRGDASVLESARECWSWSQPRVTLWNVHRVGRDVRVLESARGCSR